MLRRIAVPVASLALLVVWSAPARAQIVYSASVGAVVPVTETITDIAGPGIHFDGGIFYQVTPNFSAGAQFTYDRPFSTKEINGRDSEAQWIGVGGRAIYSAKMGKSGHWYGALGLSFYFGKFNDKDELYKLMDERHLGADISAGISWNVWEDLSLGPAVGVAFPDFGRMGEIILVNGSLRAAWGF